MQFNATGTKSMHITSSAANLGNDAEASSNRSKVSAGHEHKPDSEDTYPNSGTDVVFHIQNETI
jgi:hypothetical protein